MATLAVYQGHTKKFQVISSNALALVPKGMRSFEVDTETTQSMFHNTMGVLKNRKVSSKITKVLSRRRDQSAVCNTL